MSTPRSANLEQIFQRVEQESEKRALAEELREQARSCASSPLTPATSFATLDSATSLKRERERRRGSVSISRLGQPEPVETNPRAISRPSSKLSHFAFGGGLYRRSQSGSVDSFGSDTAETSPIDNHVTQMRQISGKQTISKAVSGMLSRTISRSRSKNNLNMTNPQNTVIDISVEKATVEQEHDNDEGMKTSRSTSTIHAALKTESPTGTFAAVITKAKDFTRLLRRGTLREDNTPRMRH